MDDVKYMKIALEEARLAFEEDEVPVGAVIVKNGKIVAKSGNKKEKYFLTFKNNCSTMEL
mgnify:CR=1 FL=1